MLSSGEFAMSSSIVIDDPSITTRQSTLNDCAGRICDGHPPSPEIESSVPSPRQLARATGDGGAETDAIVGEGLTSEVKSVLPHANDSDAQQPTSSGTS